MSEILAAGPERQPLQLPASLRRLVVLVPALALVAGALRADAPPYLDRRVPGGPPPPLGVNLVGTGRQALLLDLDAAEARPLVLPGRLARVAAIDPVAVGETVVLRLGPERGEASGANNRVVALRLPPPSSTDGGPPSPPPAPVPTSLGVAEFVIPARDGSSVLLVRRAQGGRIVQHVGLDGAVRSTSPPLPRGMRVLADTSRGWLLGPAWPTMPGPLAVLDPSTGAITRQVAEAALVQDADAEHVLWSDCPAFSCPLRRTRVADAEDGRVIDLPEGTERTGAGVLGPRGEVLMPARDARGRPVLARWTVEGTALIPMPAALPEPSVLTVDRRGSLFAPVGDSLVVVPAGGLHAYQLRVDGRALAGVRALAAR